MIPGRKRDNMTSKYSEFYNLESGPILVYTMCNFGGMAIFDILDGEYIGESVVVGDYYEKPENIRKHKTYMTPTGRPYFVRFGRRFYLDSFVRVNF